MKDEKDNITNDIFEVPESDYRGTYEHMRATTIMNFLWKIQYADLSKTDLVILHEILKQAKYENDEKEVVFFPINQKNIAEKLNMKQPNISRSISKMIKRRVLEKASENLYELRRF